MDDNKVSDAENASDPVVRAERISGDEKTARVQQIADLMALGQYLKRRTARALAKEWQVSQTTVEHYACDARRLLRMDRLSVEEARDEQLAKLDHIYARAMKAGEYRTAVHVIAAAAKISGTNAPMQLEHTGKGGAPLGLPADHPLLSLGRPPTVEELEAFAKGENKPN